MKKEKITIIVLSILLIAVAVFSIFQLSQKHTTEDVKTREELLTAVMWEITDGKTTIKKENIKEIVVLKAKSGVFPLNYDVAINMKNGDQILYSWKDESKKELLVLD